SDHVFERGTVAPEGNVDNVGAISSWIGPRHRLFAGWWRNFVPLLGHRISHETFCAVMAAPAQFGLPPSTIVFMFSAACMILVRRLPLSAARAASSGSIELSKNRV